MQATTERPAEPTPPAAREDEWRDFMLTLREALLYVVRYIERRYGKHQSPR